MHSEISQAYAQALIDTQAIHIRPITEEPFTLRSARRSYVYVNHAKIATSPHGYAAFINSLRQLLEDTYQDKEFILCNVDSKISAQMVGSLAYAMNKPQIIFKSKELTAKEKGSEEQVTGDRRTRLPVAIIDDVMTGGDGTATNVAQIIQQEFPDAEDIQIFTGLTRNQIPNTTQFPMHAVLTFEDLFGLVSNSLSSEQQQALEKEKTLNP